MKIRQLCCEAILFIIVLGGIIGNPVCAEGAGGDLLWSFYYISSSDNSSPAFYNDKIYFGNSSGRFCCLDAKSGKKIWEYTGDGYYAPTISDGIIFFATPRGVFCLDPETGKELWKYMGYFRSQVAVSNGKMFVGSYSGNLL